MYEDDGPVVAADQPDRENYGDASRNGRNGLFLKEWRMPA